MLHSGIALDVRLVTDDEYPYLLHHFSGSKDHNHALRSRAHAEGIKINEYGIFRGDAADSVRQRARDLRGVGHGVMSSRRCARTAARSRRRSKISCPLSDRGADLRGILHVHSTWSDGTGFDPRDGRGGAWRWASSYLGMCDHSKYAAYAGGLDAGRRAPPAGRRSTRSTRSSAGAFRILKGTECDILRDGALDYDDETLATFDFVVASIHSHFNCRPRSRRNG